jgi:pimeloyl-ACP methyl ester carboxylesterase
VGRYDALIDAGRRDAGFAEATRLIDSAGFTPGLADYFADVDERVWEFLKRKQDHDPIPDALALRCPHLVLFGGADELVPVAESIRLFSTAACHPNRHTDVPLTVQVFPQANHRVHTDAGARLAPGYLGFLTRWINSQASGDI